MRSRLSDGWRASSASCVARSSARSEKLAPGQFNLPLEDVEVAQGVLEAAQERARRALQGDSPAERSVPNRNRGHLPKHLPRIERIIEPASTLCPCGCDAMAKIGEDVSERLDVVPAHALRFLEGYCGQFVQCDGYEAYDKLTRVDRVEGPWTLVHGWTHARRRFVKRLEKDGSPIAEEALRRIAELHAIEKAVRGAAPDVRLAARQTLSAPIIAAFQPWLVAQLSRIPRSSKLAEDIRSTLARWSGLTRFLEDGRLELDTNPVENQIRKIALTRKNALFAGHEVGAENWAMLASLIANCKMNDVDPVSYLAETLRALLDRHPKSRIDKLMTWNFTTASSIAA